jgi:hypothetical protein
LCPTVTDRYALKILSIAFDRRVENLLGQPTTQGELNTDTEPHEMIALGFVLIARRFRNFLAVILSYASSVITVGIVLDSLAAKDCKFPS